MKTILLTFSVSLLFFDVFSQTNLKGNVVDFNTGESLIGAAIIYGKGKGTVTDFEGNYFLSLPAGERTLKVSYVGYQEINKTITVGKQDQTLDFKLKTTILNEVQVVADVAIERETPVAFSTIPIKKINEELASQDIPMILNSTPGVYATQSGGGDGDARITIRGFNQRNVAVMIDGIPVNDMENGRVYWSNWFGLDAVTSNIQVQRGLGASKLAIPSVGGTMNILTKGTGNKSGGVIKQEVGSFGKLRTSVGYNSGRLDNGWGYTLAGSYKQSDGFVDQTWSQGYFYYAKIQKELGNHILSLSAMGAPQKHGQRSWKSDIATYDTTLARELGDSSSFDTLNEDGNKRIVNKGITYNKHWGYLDRWSVDANGDTVHSNEVLNTKQNYYHKPQFALRDFWKVNDGLHISNILYASFGKGGGTSLKENREDFEYDKNGQINLQKIYDDNIQYNGREGIGPFSTQSEESMYQKAFGNRESEAETFLRSSINNHYWYGLLSTANLEINNSITLSGGMDLRYYKGEHYAEVYDLLGGDFVLDPNRYDQQNTSLLLRKGDKVGWYNDGLVKWAGIFSQLEYSKGSLSYFFNISGSNTAYKRVDYFKKKDLILDEKTYKQALGTSMVTEYYFEGERIPYEQVLLGSPTDSVHKDVVLDTIWHNGTPYTMYSKEAQYSATDWKWLRGYTIKTGANYNLDEYNNIFCNVGYISKAPKFNNVYDLYSGETLVNIENEEVNAIELGYSYRSTYFSANVNTYHTKWKNKPSQTFVEYEDIDGIKYKSNINGMDALHQGLEIDFAYKLNTKITLEGLCSFGDWKYTSSEEVRFYDEDNRPIIENGEAVVFDFDAEGVHVGDAAQTQFGLSIRYEPTHKSYVKIRGTHFDNHYADFDPISLSEENGTGGTESWITPAYQLIDMHCGYRIRLSKKENINIRLSILNLLDKTYISDALNNDQFNSMYSDFDAKSAGVFFGLGRRTNLSLQYNF